MKTTFLLFLLAMTSVRVFCQPSTTRPKTGFTSIKEDSDARSPGDAMALSNYISNHIKLPPDFSKNGHSGNVHVQFTIDSSGKIVNPKIVKSLDAACDEEALRLVSSMPNWLPAKRLGIPYASPYLLKIQFEVDEPDIDAGSVHFIISKKNLASLAKIHK